MQAIELDLQDAPPDHGLRETVKDVEWMKTLGKWLIVATAASLLLGTKDAIALINALS